MTPKFKLIANGREISATVLPILRNLSVSDESGEEADKFTLELADPEATLELPTEGALVEVSMGLGELVEFGSFVIDTVQVSGPPDTIKITGHSAPFSGGGKQAALQSRKSRSFHDKTVSDLVKSIAGEHGLDPIIDGTLAAINIGHLDQRDESDASFLNRIARDMGAALKVSTGKLAFVLRGSSKTASGKDMPTVTLDRRRGEISTWDFTASGKGGYKSVTAQYRDTVAATTTDVVVGEGEPSLRMPHVYSSAGNARRAAQSRLDDAKRSSGGKLGLALPGRLDIVAETPLEILGIRQGVNGKYVVRRVEHSLDRSGLKTRVDLESGLDKQAAP